MPCGATLRRPTLYPLTGTAVHLANVAGSRSLQDRRLLPRDIFRVLLSRGAERKRLAAPLLNVPHAGHMGDVPRLLGVVAMKITSLHLTTAGVG